MMVADKDINMVRSLKERKNNTHITDEKVGNFVKEQKITRKPSKNV